MPNKPKYWGTSRRCRRRCSRRRRSSSRRWGSKGVFAPQVYGPPFVPLADGRRRDVARAARDGHRAGVRAQPVRDGGGGDGPRPHQRRPLHARPRHERRSRGARASSAWSTASRVEHMREVVEIVRLVIAKAHTGELTRYDGKYHHLDFSEFNPLGAPAAHGHPDLDRLPAHAADPAGGGDRRRRHRPSDLVDRLGDDEGAGRPEGGAGEGRQAALRHRVQHVAVRRAERRPQAGDRGRARDGGVLRRHRAVRGVLRGARLPRRRRRRCRRA